MIKKQFTLYLENKHGELARTTEVLAAAKVNIEGISVSEGTDVGLVQIVVSNAAATKRALAKARIPFTVQDVAMLPLKNKPGVLSAVASKLAKAGVNINYVYGTSCNCGCNCDCNIIISAPNLKKVEKIWKAD